MAKIEILLPAMGEGITEAIITKWLISEGEHIEEDESIAEIATDKVDSEIPSPTDGIIEKILFQEGETPNVGDVIAIIRTEGDEEEGNIETKTLAVELKEIKENSIPEIKNLEQAEFKEVSSIKSVVDDVFLSPLVRNIIAKENITVDELSSIKGSGKDGRITKNDILSYLAEDRKPVETKAKLVSGVKETPKPKQVPSVFIGENDQVIEMDRMRKLIADYMVQSKQTSPHVTSFHEVDVTNIVNWRNKVKDEFLKRENEKLTFTPIFIEAAAKILKELPMINVAVDGYNIIVRKNINIGMATALPNGNLIVPVIKNADQKNLIGLSKSVNDLALRARLNKLLPDEIKGGTFTITNFGTFGNLTGSPIINQPEVAILGLGAIIKKPAVIETPEGDAIAIRHKVILSLAYDHRVVDGALGGMYLKKLADLLESFNPKREI